MRARLLSARQLPQYILQDSTILVIEDLLRGIDANRSLEVLLAAIGHGCFDRKYAAIGELGVEQVAETGEVVNLFAGEAQACGGFSFNELQRQNAHSDQIGPVNALVAFGDDGANS